MFLERKKLPAEQWDETFGRAKVLNFIIIIIINVITHIDSRMFARLAVRPASGPPVRRPARAGFLSLSLGPAYLTWIRMRRWGPSGEM